MRQVLIDSVRAKRAGKRGGASQHVPLDEVEEVLRAFPELAETDEDAILALHEALQRLEAESERHARIVECRFFGSMTIEETAEALAIAPATVKRGWSVAQAWLRRELGGAPPEE
jgi:RNA polymerase sigma factor (TIGR02999 family)